MIQAVPDVRASNYEPDGRWRDVVVEVKSQIHSSRNLRASLLQLAYFLAQEPRHRGLLVLLDSRITDARLHEELRLAERALRPEVARKLAVAIERNGRYRGLPDDLGGDFQEWLRELVRKQSGPKTSRQSPDAVLIVLLHQWLLHKGPMTTEWIMRTVGCSYPTVAHALRGLGPAVERISDRRVQLRYFPKDEWSRLVANSAAVRSTTCFTDRSGQRRSPDSLMRRLSKLGRSDLAVGGVIGARHYQPELDIVGTPRLDLSLHAPRRRVDWTFVQRLDPALEKAATTDARIALAVHLVTRETSLFQPSKGGVQWADPVECLLDLHEARLEPQAKEFLHYLSTRSG